MDTRIGHRRLLGQRARLAALGLGIGAMLGGVLAQIVFAPTSELVPVEVELAGGITQARLGTCGVVPDALPIETPPPGSRVVQAR